MRSISIVLICSLLYSLMACHTTKQVTKMNEIKRSLENGDELFIITNDSVRYDFNSPYNYRVENDTLVGDGKKMMDSYLGSPDSVELALADISYLEDEYFDGVKTAALLIMIGGLWFLLISTSDWKDTSK